MKSISFGTDGVRGRVGTSPITEDDFVRLGCACRLFLEQQLLPLTVAIGWDTRASSKTLANAFSRGFYKQDSQIFHLGTTPTPGISYYVAKEQLSMGVSITASHNPYTDNGLKLFKKSGCKLMRYEEAIIEELTCQNVVLKEGLNVREVSGSNYLLNALKKNFLANTFKGKRVVLDTANGATTYTTLPLLRYLGMDVIALGDQPDGMNINKDCGSEHADRLQTVVKEQNAWLGFAHDGDGDRLVVIDEAGERIDGDQVLGLLALDLFRKNQLVPAEIVVTQQSNAGLDQSLKAFNIKVNRCDVGDREVFYSLLTCKGILGGENSGHILLMQEAPTGDGLRLLLKLLELAEKRPLHERKQEIVLLPKHESSLLVSKKIPLEQLPHLSQAINLLKNTSVRTYIRYSGTENKLRFLVEADTEAQCEQHMDTLKKAAITDLCNCGAQ